MTIMIQMGSFPPLLAHNANTVIKHCDDDGYDDNDGDDGDNGVAGTADAADDCGNERADKAAAFISPLFGARLPDNGAL